MPEVEERRVPIKVTKSPEYRAVYATGVFGGLNPLEGRMIFHLDRLVPRMKEEAPAGTMETAEVERELQVEIHLSTGAFLDLYEWMKGHVEKMEKLGVIVKVQKEGSQ